MEKATLQFPERKQEIFQALVDQLENSRHLPAATYRLQLNHRFTLDQAQEIVPYLHDLGISDVYASPCFLAMKGSMHGYDILDHNRLNPEIGTEKEYGKWVKTLDRHHMGLIQDIVPNHMCIAGVENNWWQDVLENGPGSLYSDFFDIDWKPVKIELDNKVLLPILGDQYGRILDNQELVLAFKAGGFFIAYAGQVFPLGPVSYTRLLKLNLESLTSPGGAEHPDLQELFSIITALEHLPPSTEKDPEKILERRREKEIIKKRISNLYEGSPLIRDFIDRNVRTCNGQKGVPASFDLLDDLLNAQAYRFSHWRVATEEINYRRFFDINELAGLRVERLPVFLETHKLIFKLIREGKVSGLRIDHLDGLYNPVEYFYRLQKACFIQRGLRKAEPEMAPAWQEEEVEEELGRWYDERLREDPTFFSRSAFYIIGEKILLKNERMPEDWPIFGSVGYVFLNAVNGIFVDQEKASAFEGLYHRFIGYRMNYGELVYEKKKLIMQVAMSAEINVLAHTLDRLTEKNRYTRDFTLNSLQTAITEVIACFPVYRTYVNQCQVLERDRHYIEQSVARARRRNPALSALIFDFLEKNLLFRSPEEFGAGEKEAWLDFVMRFQQFTGPVMAKGLEDTVFYIYNRLLSLNEVGGHPEDFGTPLEAFHGRNIENTKSWPHGLNATSTHDTKRSEDIRARINVLSEMPDKWEKCLRRWGRMNKKKKKLLDGQEVPDPNEEYLLYQTLLGAWPLHPEDKPARPFIERIASSLIKKLPNYPEDEPESALFIRRIKDHMVKAIREAKIHSSWISSNSAYEEAVLHFVDALLTPSPDNAFQEDFETFQQIVAYWGMLNSLAQTLLKIASPGIPDFYQGTELWDFSLTDPDNRRPVDFKIRQELLKKLLKQAGTGRRDLTGLAGELLRDWPDGRIKLYVTFRALNYRRENRFLFAEGSYLPLNTEGRLNKNLCAFARRKEEDAVLVVVPRLLAGLGLSPGTPPLGKVWEDTGLILPEEITGNRFYNIFTGETARVLEREGRKVLLLEEVFAFFPLALLTSF